MGGKCVESVNYHLINFHRWRKKVNTILFSSQKWWKVKIKSHKKSHSLSLVNV